MEGNTVESTSSGKYYSYCHISRGGRRTSRSKGVRLGDRKIRDSIPACDGIFHTSDLKKKKLALQWLPCHAPRVSAGTGRAGVSILCLGEVESLMFSFCLSVAARKIV